MVIFSLFPCIPCTVIIINVRNFLSQCFICLRRVSSVNGFLSLVVKGNYRPSLVDYSQVKLQPSFPSPEISYQNVISQSKFSFFLGLLSLVFMLRCRLTNFQKKKETETANRICKGRTYIISFTFMCLCAMIMKVLSVTNQPTRLTYRCFLIIGSVSTTRVKFNSNSCNCSCN